MLIKTIWRQKARPLRTCIRPWGRVKGFSALALDRVTWAQGPVSRRSQKVFAKFRSLWFQSCFIQIFLIWTEVPSYKKFPVDTLLRFQIQMNSVKIALRARKVSRALEKWAPGQKKRGGEVWGEKSRETKQQQKRDYESHCLKNLFFRGKESE